MRSSFVKYLGIANLLILSTNPGASADPTALTEYPAADWINEQLQEFKLRPKDFLNSHKSVEKLDPITSKPISSISLFSKEQIADESFVEKKIQQKNHLLMSLSFSEPELMPNSAIQRNDAPENLVDTYSVNTLEHMERSGLRAQQLKSQPWSDYYWATYQGGLANRYADPRFPRSKIWSENIDYIFSHSCSVETLSPAEKYDLLVGDPRWTMTRSVVADAQRYVKADGTIEPWMGICHGWAAAAFMMNRPQNSITVLAADGRTKIPFFPSDLKALGSMLWATTSPPSRFIGGRCNDQNPAQDELGRVLSQNCFDTNPGTWHLAVVNQIGVAQRSMIMDATFDYEVWNQPIYAYSYSYFNPITQKAVNTLSEALVRKDQFSQDRFKSYRHPRTAFMVGVVMKAVYVAETLPQKTSKDPPELDKLVAVKYIYDLELDSEHRIIGGEWYTNKHPDFLWVPPVGTSPVSEGDKILNQRGSRAPGRWNPQTEAVPSAWAEAAKVSSRYRQPLTRIVDSLFELSHFGL